jgi:hypothetical protein
LLYSSHSGTADCRWMLILHVTVPSFYQYCPGWRESERIYSYLLFSMLYPYGDVYRDVYCTNLFHLSSQYSCVVGWVDIPIFSESPVLSLFLNTDVGDGVLNILLYPSVSDLSFSDSAKSLSPSHTVHFSSLTYTLYTLPLNVYIVYV